MAARPVAPLAATATILLGVTGIVTGSAAVSFLAFTAAVLAGAILRGRPGDRPVRPPR